MQDSSSQYSFSELLALCDEFKALSFAHKDEIGQKDAEDWKNRISEKTAFFETNSVKSQSFVSRINEAIVRVVEEALHRYYENLLDHREKHPKNSDCEELIRECHAFFKDSREGNFENQQAVKERLKALAEKARAFLAPVIEGEAALPSVESLRGSQIK